MVFGIPTYSIQLIQSVRAESHACTIGTGTNCTFIGSRYIFGAIFLCSNLRPHLYLNLWVAHASYHIFLYKLDRSRRISVGIPQFVGIPTTAILPFLFVKINLKIIWRRQIRRQGLLFRAEGARGGVEVAEYPYAGGGGFLLLCLRSWDSSRLESALVTS